MLRQIKEVLANCKLQLHPEKIKIVNIRGFSEKKHPEAMTF